MSNRSNYSGAQINQQADDKISKPIFLRHWNTNISKQNLKDDVLSSFLLRDIQTFKAPWK